MKEIAKKNASVWIFLAVQAILYATFLTLDLTGGSIRLTASIKYTIIIVCFCYALLMKSAYKGILFLLQVGLFFTLISDLFILILDYYLVGVYTFLLVQLIYGLRLILLQEELSDASVKFERKGRKYRLFQFFLRRLLIQTGFAAVIYIVLQLVGVTPDPLLMVSVLYFIGILFNTITAVRLSVRDRKNRSNLLYATGMVLFLLCDINVGLFNLSGFISLPEEIYSVIYSLSSILMWTFYAPSQVLITMSGKYLK